MILARLRSILDTLSVSDAGDPLTPAQVLRNQAGHCLIGVLMTALMTAALTPGWAALAGVGAWALIWEGRQYLRRGVARWTAYRDWLWDGVAYGAGGALAWAMLPAEPPWWLPLAALGAAAAVLGIALARGKLSKEVRQFPENP